MADNQYSPSHERDTKLLRSELFSIEQLKRHAISLADNYKIDPRSGADKLLPRLSENARILRAVYDFVATAAMPGQRIVPAETWLLDNFYLIEQQINLAFRHLPRGYSQQLPRLLGNPLSGFPRIYDLALELISHMDGRIDESNAPEFLTAFQTVTPLKLGELWAYPIMLRLALLENLRRVAIQIAARREELADVPLTAAFVEEFYARLQAQGPVMAFVQAWVEHRLSEQGATATQLSAAAGRIAAANQISIANSIGSLRFIGVMDWQSFVESLSHVEQILKEDPAEMYSLQDFATRDRYRHVVEDIARQSSWTEIDVARQVVTLAKSVVVKQGDTAAAGRRFTNLRHRTGNFPDV